MLIDIFDVPIVIEVFCSIPLFTITAAKAENTTGVGSPCSTHLKAKTLCSSI
jgi:hypothetical protein